MQKVKRLQAFDKDKCEKTKRAVAYKENTNSLRKIGNETDPESTVVILATKNDNSTAAKTELQQRHKRRTTKNGKSKMLADLTMLRQHNERELKRRIRRNTNIITEKSIETPASTTNNRTIANDSTTSRTVQNTLNKAVRRHQAIWNWRQNTDSNLPTTQETQQT